MQLEREKKRKREKQKKRKTEKEKKEAEQKTNRITEGHIFLLVKTRAPFRFMSSICNVKACFYLAVT
jgi:hypothetical protein